jgi:hypothetical protein
MLVTVLFAVRADSLDDASVEVERALGITLEARESSFHGGDYFKFRGTDVQEIVLQENIEIPEMEPAEEDFPDQRYLLYLSGFPQDSPLLAALETAPETFQKLRAGRR